MSDSDTRSTIKNPTSLRSDVPSAYPAGAWLRTGNERGRARCDRARPRLASAAERADVLRLRALLALGHAELDPLVVFEAAEPGRVDRRVVNEDVGTPVVWGDEAEPLLGVEPLHSALNHLLCLPFEDRRGAHVARLGLLATARLTETCVGVTLHPYCVTPHLRDQPFADLRRQPELITHLHRRLFPISPNKAPRYFAASAVHHGGQCCRAR